MPTLALPLHHTRAPSFVTFASQFLAPSATGLNLMSHSCPLKSALIKPQFPAGFESPPDRVEKPANAVIWSQQQISN